MAASTQRTTSDGSLELLDLSLNYLDRSEITVFFDLVLTSDWSWVGEEEKRIAFSPAVPIGVEVLVKRTTDISELRHSFVGGAAFRAQTLDEDLLQVLHIAQEASEANLSGEFYTDINMHNYRITNIGPAVDLTDALTLGQYQADAAGAGASKIAAEAASASATASASTASTAASTATIKAGLATTAAAEASADADLAETARIAAVAAEAAATAAYESFDDRYLGPKGTEPTVDNDGNLLTAGVLYFNTVTGVMMVHTGSVWTVAYAPSATTASAVSVSPTGSLESTNVQAALVEVLGDVEAHVADATDAHAASAISYAGGTGISATTVEGALDELATEKLDSSAIGVTVQAYDADTAYIDQSQTWTGAPKSAPLTDNDLSFDISAKKDFVCTPTAGGTLTFTNIAAGARGEILLVNSSNYAIAKAAAVKASTTFLTTISASGRYIISYRSLDGTNVDCTVSGALS